MPMSPSIPNKRPELLAPAGDFERLRIAVAYGADAVYLAGRRYGLRAGSGNFEPDELAQAIAFAHEKNVRVYVALNIFAHPDDFLGLPETIRGIRDAGADAVIVSDVGVLSQVRHFAPDLAIHISTQASVTNAAACRFFHENGASRIVLARELTLQEIRQIHEEIPPTLELETFVHGSVCLSYSGRCLLSHHLMDRDANRGQCAQPCRWSWQLTPTGHPDQPLLLEEDERGSYLLNARDLCLVDHLAELADAGITSFKIEGRKKSPHYVAAVTNVYRKAIDAWAQDSKAFKPDPAWHEELEKTVHRAFDTGFYFRQPKDDASILSRSSDVRDATVIGIVRAWRPTAGLMLVEQRNRLVRGDTVELVSPGLRIRTFKADRILDLDLNELEKAPHPQMYYYLPSTEPVTVGSFLRRVDEAATV